MIVLTVATPVGAEDPASLLAKSDAISEWGLAHADPTLAVTALTLAAEVDGHVFLPGGRATDIRYAERRAGTIRAADGDRELLRCIVALPDVDRSVVRSAALAKPITERRGWPWRIAFRGEFTILYERSQSEQPLPLIGRVAGWTSAAMREHRAAHYTAGIRSGSRMQS